LRRLCVSRKRERGSFALISKAIRSRKERVRRIEDAGGTAVAEQCDVSVESDVASAQSPLRSRSTAGWTSCSTTWGSRRPGSARCWEEHTAEDFERLTAVNFRGVFFGCKHAVLQFKTQGGGGVIPQHRVRSRARRMGRLRLRRDQGRGASAHPGCRHRRSALRHPGERHLPGRHALHQFHGGGRDGRPGGCAGTARCPDRRRAHRSASRILAEDCAEAAVYLVVRPGCQTSRGVLLPIDGGYVAR